MDELVRWLGQQLDEDERTARRAADYDDGAAHDVHGPPGTWACLDESEWFGPSYRGGTVAPRIGNVNAPELGAHIVAWHPARVLRGIDAKRQTLAELEAAEQTMEQATRDRDTGRYNTARAEWVVLRRVVRRDAAVYADRPGYQEGWRP